MAMDWDTAGEVAVCLNRSGYQKIGEHGVALLQEHGICSLLMYFVKSGGLTEDDKHAARWGLWVGVADVAKASKVLSEATDPKLRNTLQANPVLPSFVPPTTIEPGPPPPKKTWWRFWQ